MDLRLARPDRRRAGWRTPTTDEWTIARAAAASSCLPGAFADMRFRNDPDVLKDGMYADHDRRDLVKKIDLTDGGIYDNLGVEPVWQDHEVIPTPTC